MAFASNDTVKAMKCIRPLVLITDITLAENRFPVSAGDRRPPLLTPGTAGDLLRADADLVAEENLGVLRLPPWPGSPARSQTGPPVQALTPEKQRPFQAKFLSLIVAMPSLTQRPCDIDILLECTEAWRCPRVVQDNDVKAIADLWWTSISGAP
ncbi:hypothetical protein ACIRD4_11530 [Streptomyces clavifer]|uniref:hypothetical protein n=1 Tax=Streptomyces clavifer TaxID=68188 RepID=UPI0038109EEB